MTHPHNKDITKNVTIRGVDAVVYEDFSRKIKRLDMNIGDAISKMMRDIAYTFDDAFPDLNAETLREFRKMDKATIEYTDSMIISAKDLVEARAKITFSHVTNLKFDNDVTREIFMNYVEVIGHCQNVSVPNTIPRLLIQSKMYKVANVKIYDAI